MLVNEMESQKKLSGKYSKTNLIELDTGEIYSFFEWEKIIGEKPYSIVNKKGKTIKGRRLDIIIKDGE